MNFKKFIETIDQWVIDLSNKGFLFRELKISITQDGGEYIIMVLHENRIIRYLKLED